MLQPELMDDPALEPARHMRALDGLARINRLSFASRTHLGALLDAWAALRRPVHVLDVACGGGEVSVGLARLGRRRGVRTRLTLLDVNRSTVDRAVRHAAEASVTADGIHGDVLQGPLSRADLVVCSLFLHHLDEARIVRALANMRAAAAWGMSISDLRRGRWGSLLAGSVPRAVTGSDVVHTDAVISARAALTCSELSGLAGRAGMSGAIVRARFPARLHLRWEAPR